MTVYVVTGTPTEDGRIQDIRLVPPPGGNTVGQVLYWNPNTQQPEWRLLSDFVVVAPPVVTYYPLANQNNQWLIDNLGRRLVGLPAAV